MENGSIFMDPPPVKRLCALLVLRVDLPVVVGIMQFMMQLLVKIMTPPATDGLGRIGEWITSG